MKIQVQGKRSSPGGADRLLNAGTVKAAVRLAVSRGNAELIELPLDPADLVEFTTEDNAVLWLRQDELADMLAASGMRGRDAAGRETLVIPRALPLPQPPDGRETRSAGLWSVSRIAVISTAETVTQAAMLAEGDEADMGLRRWSRDGTLTAPDFPADLPALPWLLFIHGTASTTQGSFGKLRESRPRIWEELHALYPDRILAFEHRSLTRDPVQNAADLLKALPKGIELHLVTHSRGGLIGELLARNQVLAPRGDSVFDKTDLELFASDPEAARRLQALGLALAATDTAPRVTRFLRVACPARGTSLADGRLDRWLTLLFNVLRLTAGTLTSELQARVEMLGRLAVAAAASRDNPEALPGIAAMAPDHAPLQILLNRQQSGKADDGLMVIGGDSQPSGVLQSLALWFMDGWFGRDNDLVVDTASMDGGMWREPPPPIFIDRGRNVNHFNYFENESTASALLAGLRGQGGRHANTEPAETAFRRAEAPGNRAAGDDDAVLLGRGAVLASPALLRGRGRPLGVILPGISGSHLAVGGRRVWCSPAGLCTRGVGALKYGATVTPDGVVESYYGGLRAHLQRTHEVMTLAYDWRRPMQEVGASVARFVREQIDRDPQRPLHIVAHSMGGLVARMALLAEPRLMQAMRGREGSRLVMLGTPNGGAHAMAVALLGRSRLVKALAIISMQENLDDVTRVMSGWPGALQLLPRAFLDPSAWPALPGANPPQAGALALARDFWARMKGGAGIPTEQTRYIAGMGETCHAIDIRPGPNGPELRLSYTDQGDGNVLWSTGIPAGVPAWYAAAEHGDLCRKSAIHPAITDLLLEGGTSALPTRPGRRDEGTAPPYLRTRSDEVLATIPSQRQLLAMAMGGSPPDLFEEAPPTAVVRVRVVHGDLTRADHPVLVGHYLGDPISGSEAALDAMPGVDGRLSRRARRGLHPELIGSSDVHLFDAPAGQEGLRGCIVAGLGVISNLSTGTLTQAIRTALLAYVDAAEQRGCGRERPLAVSAVLLGSGGGVVSVDVCVTALLRAVEQVNRIGDDHSPSIGEVEIIEAVEQTAITAWHAARARIAHMPGRFELPRRLEQGKGGWRRTGPETNPDSWIEVTVTAADPRDPADTTPNREGPLHYLLVDRRARVEAETVTDSRRLVHHFIDQVPNEIGRADPEGISAGRTLYELLWPARLKQHSLEDRNMRLILDRETAALPWEMLDDRRPDGDRRWLALTDPPSVRFGVLRQLVSQRDRPAPPWRGGSRTALVIGDPAPQGSPLPELPGARIEARAVAAQLEACGYRVTSLIGEDAGPASVISRLLAQSWDVIHIAGHGVIDWSPGPGLPPRSGIVLGGSPAEVIGAGTLAQLVAPPELFFLNCCHLGNIPLSDQHLRRDRPGMAASIAVELIESGCPAVIACGWPVDDSAALRFAEAFYGAMCEGQNLGVAVRRARQATYNASGLRDNSWGAYQCYGHPGFALGADAAAASRSRLDPASAAEALAMIQRLETEAGTRTLTRDGDGLGALIGDLDGLAGRIRDYGWQDRSDILSALGDAYDACGQHGLALQAYEAAARAQSPQLPVSALQQCLALSLHQGDRTVTAGQLRRAQKILDALGDACGPSLPRLKLQADICQRLATLSQGDRGQALEDMGAYLSAAVVLAADLDDPREHGLQLRHVIVLALQKRSAGLGHMLAQVAIHLPDVPLIGLARALLAPKSRAVADLIARVSDPESPPLSDAERAELSGMVELVRACLPKSAGLQADLKRLAQALA